MAAPPKPWNHQSTPSLFENSMSTGPPVGPAGAAGLGSASPFPTSSLAASPPSLPPRPSTSSALSRPMYGGSYSGYGGYGGGMYGGFGNMYNPYGGVGGYGYNRFGMQGDVPGSSFARLAEENSRPAFQSIESIVHAVNSVSMMLDSSFQAVYSSFRAVIGVADNFSRLRTQLVQIFSALAFIRTLRYVLRRFLELLRLRPAGQAEREWQEALAQAAGEVATGGDSQPKKSAWPIIMFFGIILGGPWLIWKLIASFSSTQEESWAKGESDHVVSQALYSFTGQGEEELSFSAGQQIILAPKELQPHVRGWLLGAVDGRKGLVPYNYIKVLGKRRGQPSVPTSSLSAPSLATPTARSPSANSGVCGSLQTSPSDMDAVFGEGQQQASPLVEAASREQFASTQSHSMGDLDAADILERQTGE